MNIKGKVSIEMYLIVCLIVIMTFGLVILECDIHQRPTRIQTIAICDSIINADTLSIFDKRTTGRLESCLYTLIEIERGMLSRWELKRDLEKHLRWLADREEQRQAMARDKHEEEK